MADKTAHPPPPPPPASLAKEAAPGPFPVVQFVGGWALCTSLIYALIYTINLYAPSPGDSCVKLTDAEAAKIDGLWQRMGWYAAPQAAVAALALMLLPCRRRWVWWIRRALACVALAAAIVSHYMYTTGVGVVVAANPAYLSFRIPCSVTVFAFAVGDFLCFLALFLPGGEE